MPSSSNSVSQLQRALSLAQQIERLEAEMAAILGAAAPSARAAKPASTAPAAAPRKGRRRGTISPEGRARIIAAQKARWAKVRREKGTAGKGSKPAKSKTKGGLTSEGRARLAALMKARWAARRKGAPAPNAKGR